LKILYIFREEPPENVKNIVEHQSSENTITSIRLYEGKINYDDVINCIFSHDRVISW